MGGNLAAEIYKKRRLPPLFFYETPAVLRFFPPIRRYRRKISAKISTRVAVFFLQLHMRITKVPAFAFSKFFDIGNLKMLES